MAILLIAVLAWVLTPPAATGPTAATEAAEGTGGPTGEIFAGIGEGALAPLMIGGATQAQLYSTAALSPAAIGTGRFAWPLSGRITQYFSKRHNGIDIARPRGSAIHAADRGQVSFAGWSTDGLGYAVRINHNNGYVTIYGHMMKKPSVRVGQLVKKGQVIGYVGSTGRSTGPHVHFIIRSPSRVYYNPLRFLK